MTPYRAIGKRQDTKVNHVKRKHTKVQLIPNANMVGQKHAPEWELNLNVDLDKIAQIAALLGLAFAWKETSLQFSDYLLKNVLLKRNDGTHFNQQYRLLMKNEIKVSKNTSHVKAGRNYRESESP